jgi:hypothetical protein
VGMPAGCFWNAMMPYATTTLLAELSGCQCM